MELVYGQKLSDKATLKIYQGVSKNIFTRFLLKWCKFRGAVGVSGIYNQIKIRDAHLQYKIFYKKSFKFFKKFNFNKKIFNCHYYFYKGADEYSHYLPDSLFEHRYKHVGIYLKILTTDLQSILQYHDDLIPTSKLIEPYQNIMDIIIKHSESFITDYEQTLISDTDYNSLNKELIFNQSLINKNENINNF